MTDRQLSAMLDLIARQLNHAIEQAKPQLPDRDLLRVHTGVEGKICFRFGCDDPTHYQMLPADDYPELQPIIDVMRMIEELSVNLQNST